jgi:hypothetical protein
MGDDSKWAFHLVKIDYFGKQEKLGSVFIPILWFGCLDVLMVKGLAAQF